MCGRVTLTTPDVNQVAALLDARVAPEHAALYRPRYNAAPTDLHWIVQSAPEGRVLVPARWGFAGAGGALVINARSETAPVRFREPFARRRVVVPADGFYEWTGPRDDRRPLWFRPRQGGLLYLAGLAATLPDGTPCFVILTTGSTGEVARIHDRMPVILPRERVQEWLDCADPSLLLPADVVTGTEVSPLVNDVKNDDASVLEPPRAPPPSRQLSLL